MKFFVSGAAGWQHELFQVREGGAGHGRDPAGAGGRLPPGLLRLLGVQPRPHGQGHTLPGRRRQKPLLQRLLQQVSQSNTGANP